jgi:hypothetical protein
MEGESDYQIVCDQWREQNEEIQSIQFALRVSCGGERERVCEVR